MSSYEDGLRTLYGDPAVDPRGSQVDTPSNQQPIGPADDDVDRDPDPDDLTVGGPDNDGDPTTTIHTPTMPHSDNSEDYWGPGTDGLNDDTTSSGSSSQPTGGPDDRSTNALLARLLQMQQQDQQPQSQQRDLGIGAVAAIAAALVTLVALIGGEG